MHPLLLVGGWLAAQAASNLALTLSATDVDYSDAVGARVTLTAAGLGAADKRIDVYVVNDAHGLRYSAGTLPSTGADGSAGPLRIRFVAGAYGVEQLFAVDPAGEPYRVEAVFAGDGQVATATGTAELRLHREGVTVAMPPEQGTALGESVLLSATLTDDNGDAEETGTAASGRQPKAIVGVPLHFYLDLNRDGDYGDLDEALGAATTNGAGVASLRFDSTPIGGLPRVGLHADAVHVEFSGDDRYKTAAGSGDLRLTAAAVDPSRTVLTAIPTTAVADGTARIALDVLLVDRFNSPLGRDDDPHVVTLATDRGDLEGSVARDGTTGHYGQALTSTQPGKARVTASIDGVAGPSIEVTFEGSGCGCAGAPPSLGHNLLLLVVMLAWQRRREP